MINFIEDSYGEVLSLKKSNHFLSGSTTPLSDSSPSLISFETRDSLLEEFADELTLLDPHFHREMRISLPPPGDECEYSVPDSQTINFLTFSNPLFDDFASSNDKSSHEENDHFDAKSYLPESPLNHDTLTVFSPRNDPLYYDSP
ncbi:hypothetical protein Tco_1531348 [Tanacetum coccineum]